jgi:hypothetical protein
MHCCEAMVYGIDEARSIVYIPEFREYGARILDGGSSIKVIYYCPWCATKLPSSLRMEWFDEMDKLGLEWGDPNTPAHLQDDTWWRQAE